MVTIEERVKAVEAKVEVLRNHFEGYLKEEIEFREEQGKLIESVINQITTLSDELKGVE